MYKRELESCKLCRAHLGVKESFVKCGKTNEFTRMIPIFLNQDNKTIKNGIPFVECSYTSK